MMSRGLMSRSSRLRIAAPARKHSSSFAGSSAGIDELYGSDMPRASIAEAIVLAVYMPPQAPAPGQAFATIACRVALVDPCRPRIRRSTERPRRCRASRRRRQMARADRAAVDHQRRPIDPAHRDQAAGHVLVAAGKRDVGVVPLGLHHGFDRVGDQVARLQRIAHARRCPSRCRRSRRWC